MHQLAEELFAQKRKKAFEGLHIRTGVALGTAVVGNFGSEQRFDYTAMGDVVNLASRLEGVNKQYGTSICINAALAQRLPDFPQRKLDLIKVKGKTQATPIYELPHAEVDDAVFASFADALALYMDANFAEAAVIFKKLRAKDSPSAIFYKRCEALLATPPSEWKGVWEMKSK